MVSGGIGSHSLERCSGALGTDATPDVAGAVVFAEAVGALTCAASDVGIGGRVNHSFCSIVVDILKRLIADRMERNGRCGYPSPSVE